MFSSGRISAKQLFILYLFCLLAAVSYSVTQLPIIGFIATCVICLCVFKVSYEELFPFLFGLQFLRIVIPFSIGSSSYGFILFVYLCLFFKIIQRGRILKDCIPIFILLILDILTSASAGIFKIGDNINWIGSLVFVVYVLKYWKDKINYEELLIYFCLAEWTVCIINIVAEYRIFGQSLVPSMYGVFTPQLGAFAFGKAYAAVAGGNGISFNNVLAIALCIIQIPKSHKISKKFFFVVSSIFFLYTGLMVISRGFYVELLMFVFLYILSLVKNPKKFFIVLSIGVILGLIFYKYLYTDLLSVFTNVTKRFEAGNADRGELINNAQVLLSTDLKVFLFGGGSYYPESFGFTCHNIFWDSFMSLGIFGLILYWSTIVRLVFISLKGNIKFKISAFIPMIMFIVFKTISGSIRDVGFYYYIALVVIYAVDCCKTNKKEVVKYE